MDDRTRGTYPRRGRPRRKLSPLHMLVLGIVYTDHSASAAHMARQLGLGADEVARLCAELEAAGYLELAALH